MITNYTDFYSLPESTQDRVLRLRLFPRDRLVKLTKWLLDRSTNSEERSAGGSSNTIRTG